MQLQATIESETMNPEMKSKKSSKKVSSSSVNMLTQAELIAAVSCASPSIPDDSINTFYGGGAAVAASSCGSSVASFDHENEDDFENKFSLVIRKPQEGKTFICISNITTDKTKNIHIVLTMNTLASGMQFFGRMEEEVGSKRIIVFNSKKSTAGGCLHAKTVNDIMVLIRTHPDIKVIVCCAHEKRIRESIPQLFAAAADSKSFENRKFAIHIDEAHKYIPENRSYIVDFNASPTVFKITGYTGTPKKIWVKIKKLPNKKN